MCDPALAAAQRLLVDAVRRTSAVADCEDIARRVEHLVAPSARGMSPCERVEVYRAQFWLRHVSNIEDDYPTLAFALGGTTAFRHLATQYLGACPPRTWNLRQLGADLPAYLASHAPWKDDLLACDAARLDWAFMEVFDAPDAPPFDAQRLARAPEEAWPTARIAFHPAIRAVGLSYPVHDLREAVRRGDRADRPPRHACPVVIWRTPAYALHARAIEAPAFELLLALRGGAPLGEACEAVAASDSSGDLGPRLSAWFQQWTSDGWVSAVRFDE